MQLENPQAICGAKCKNSGKKCPTPPMPNGKCRVHGGKTPTGMGLPQFTTGRYSKYLPSRLLTRYNQAEHDPELLVARQEIALIDSRIADILTRVDTGESGSLWRQAGDAMADMRAARATQNNIKFAEGLNNLEGVITAGATDYAAWDEVGKLIQLRQRMVESERKRLVEMHQVITAERAMVLVAALIDTVRKHVTDRPTLAAISADLARITNSANADPGA